MISSEAMGTLLTLVIVTLVIWIVRKKRKGGKEKQEIKK